MQAEDNVVELNRDREAPVARLSFEELFPDVHDRLYRAHRRSSGAGLLAGVRRRSGAVKTGSWSTLQAESAHTDQRHTAGVTTGTDPRMLTPHCRTQGAQGSTEREKRGGT